MAIDSGQIGGERTEDCTGTLQKEAGIHHNRSNRRSDMPEKIGFSAALKRVAPGFGILWIIERRLTAGGG